jgi:hypothetical protein
VSGYFENWNAFRESEMTLVALFFCLLLVAVAAVGVVSPSRLLDALRKIQTPGGLISLGVLRVFVGVALLFVASVSKAPEIVAIVGVIAIIRGVTLPLIGVERVRKLLDWWSAKGSLFHRGWALLAGAMGLGLAYAVFP